MNKHCHRVIFSRVLQRRVVVAESVRMTQGHPALCSENPATAVETLRVFCAPMQPLLAGVRLALGLLVVVGLAQADIVADASAAAAQRPAVLNTANGLPQVNIQTPSAAGVSRNTYSQFDVGAQGAILNNSRVDVQTQLGGWVTANPWLARGPARVILNEVNSAAPSLLQGYIEVAGQCAQVVVANPAGISCNGCGFINASRTTLSTGSPVMNGGNLESFVVQRGTISIEGLGMDATRSDYSDVIARAVQINAGLWTQQLNVVTGAVQVEAATGDAAPAVLGLATATGAAPRHAVDVSALGGMYAGKIHLMGTEAGMGVVNAGAIGASAGEVAVDSQGQLSNSGRINASAALNITTQQGVDNSGTLYAQQSLSVVAAGDVDNRNIMAAGQDVSLHSDGRIDSAPGTLLAAGLDTEGRLHDNGTLSLQAARDISLHGQVLAGSALTLQAANIDLAGSQAQAADMRFTTPGNLNLDRATVQASRQLALSAGQTLQTTAAILSAPQQLLEAHDVDNSGGLISSAGDISLSASALNNSGGIIQAQGNQSLMLGSGVIDNRGSLLYAGATLAITAGTLLNSNTLGDAQGLQGKTLSLQLDTLDNTQGALRASDKLSVTSHGDINNSAGLMSAQGDLLLQDSDPGQRALQMLNTDGIVIADRSLALTMASLSGDGKLLSPGRIAISLDQDFTNSRLVQAGTDLQLGSKGLVSNQGQLLSTGNLTLQAARVDNSTGAEINATTLRLDASDTLTNRGVVDGGDVRLVIGNMLSNRGTGRIYGDRLALQAGTLLNTDEVLNGVSTAAVIAARNRLDIGVDLLRNEHDALIFSGGAMAVGGALDSDGMAVGQAGEVDNIGSQIEASTALSLAAATLNNRNADFQTEIAPVGTPQTLFSLDPADDGNNNQYDIGNFERYSWSRTYKYRWKTAAADTAAAPEPGKTPLPQVGETEDCAADPCVLLPTADYAAGNAAWSYFQIAPPAPEPAAPVMAEPVPPAGLETDPAYAAAWQTYRADKAVYDSAWANYNTTHASWQAATDTAYATLDNKIETYNAQFSSSGNFNKWTEYHLTQTETETRVTRSAPARLLAGGDMVLRGAHLVNDKSQIIAGGLLSGDLGALDNIEAEGVHVVHKEGTSQYTDTRWRGGTRRYYQRNWYPEAPYQPADQVSTITLPVTKLQANTQPAGSGATLPANAQSALPAGAGGLVAPVTPSVDIRIILPDSALFLLTPAANSHVLVETDPRFANYRSWLSSDYLLNAMSFDPARTQKRLGDGFYEQKLVREQIAQLTGLRFLEGYRSDEEQYRALMNNAVTFAQAYKLRPGLALTAAQMAALTSDIVWLVEETVTLPDGSRQTVLAPRVYLKPHAGDLKGDGTLIAAEDINLKLQGNFTNSGTVAGREVMKITADNIRNLGGRLDAGALSLAARNDLDNQGGLLTARNSAHVTAGHDITMASTTQATATTVGDSSFSRSALDRMAGLYVNNPGGTLTLAAGHDLTLTAAQVVNAGSGGSTVSAGRDLKLNAIKTAYENNARGGASYSMQEGASRDIGTTLASGSGGLQLIAGHDLSAVAVAATTTGALRLDAGNDLAISSGHATSHHATASNSGHGDQSRQSNSSDVLGSSLNGSSVALTARQGDLTIKGSQVAAQAGDVSLAAGKGIALLADEAGSDSSSHMHSGGHGKTLNREESSHSRTQVATQIAATGNAALTAEGGDLTLAASGVKAGGNITAKAAGDVNVISGVNYRDYSLETAKKGQTKYSNHQEGYVQETLAGAGFEAEGNLRLDGKGDVNLAAAQLKSAGMLQIGDAIVQKDEQGNALHDDKGRLVVERGTVKDINDTAVELRNENWSATQRGYTGAVKALIDTAALMTLNTTFITTAGPAKLPETVTAERSRQRIEKLTAETSTLQGQDILLSAQDEVNLQGTGLQAKGAAENGGNIAVLAKSIDLGVAGSTRTESHSSGKSTTRALGMSTSTGKLQLGGVQQTDQDSTDTTVSTHYQGVTARAQNILLQADNRVDLVAARLQANPEQGTLAVLGDKVLIGGIQDTQTITHTDKTETKTLAVTAGNAVLDTGLAAKALANGIKGEKQALDALIDARQRVKEGSLTSAALKDYEANLAAATANLVQLKIALGVTAATAAASTATAGFYVSGSTEKETTVSTQSVTSGAWQGSELGGHQLTLTADDVLIKGSRIGADQAVMDAKRITLAAGENTVSHSESTQQNKNGVTVNASLGNVSGGVNTGRNESAGEGSSSSKVNSQLTFGHLDSSSDALTLAGGTLEADTANLHTKTLTITDQQDTSASLNRSSGYTAGVSAGSSGITGVNGSLSRGSGSSESATVSSPSGIIVHDGANSRLKADRTDMIGGIIANATRDAKGKLVDQGQLQADLGVLTTHELNNYNHSDQRGLSVGGSMGLNSSGTAKPGSGSPPHGTPGSSEAVTDPARGTLTLGETHSGHSTEGITRSTIGQGAITATTADGSDVLASVNRDLNTASLITRDQDTHGLDATATVDARWMTSAGRKDLLAQEKQSDALLAITGLAAGAAITSIATSELDQTGTAIGKVVNAGVIAKDDPRLAKMVEQVDDGQLSNTPELSQRVDMALSPENEAAGGRVNLTDNLTDERGRPVNGAASTHTNTLYINASGTGPLVDVLAHESMHLSGAGESLSSTTGWLANAAFGVGSWAQGTAVSQASVYNFAPLTAAASAANSQAAIIEQLKGQLDYWGSVGHQSTMAAMMYAGGLSATKAKLMGEAAWAPDTDSRNAMSLTSLMTAFGENGSQKNNHALDGRADYVKDQVEGIRNVKEIISEIKDMNDEEAARYLSQKEVQNKLHKAGDAFAHVNDDPKEHYSPLFGHLLDSVWPGASARDPDAPHENSDAYIAMSRALYRAAVEEVGQPRMTDAEVTEIANTIVDIKPTTSPNLRLDGEDVASNQNKKLSEIFGENVVPMKPAPEYGFLGVNHFVGWLKSVFSGGASDERAGDKK